MAAERKPSAKTTPPREDAAKKPAGGSRSPFLPRISLPQGTSALAAVFKWILYAALAVLTVWAVWTHCAELAAALRTCGSRWRIFGTSYSAERPAKRRRKRRPRNFARENRCRGSRISRIRSQKAGSNAIGRRSWCGTRSRRWKPGQETRVVRVCRIRRRTSLPILSARASRRWPTTPGSLPSCTVRLPTPAASCRWRALPACRICGKSSFRVGSPVSPVASRS